ncbi:MAG: hypothetical protein ACK50N_05620 [Flavobacteriales bacterium]
MSKFMAIFQLAILTLIPALIFGQNIQIEVFNKTGYNLDSVSFHHFYLGKIIKDSTFFLSGIDEITMQGDVPLNQPFGLIEGKKRPFNLTPCGTKSKKRKEGSYAFDLFIYETGNEYRLYWKKHE